MPAERFLARRNLVPEQMDADDVDPRALAKALRFIRQINTLLRYNASLAKTILSTIDAIVDRVVDDCPLTVLDVGAGSGDLLAEIRHRYRLAQPLELIGLDRHAATVAQGAAGEASRAAVRFVRGNALALPFADASVDVVVSTLSLHHLPEAAAIAALAEMARVARHGVIVADLIRSRRAYAWIVLFTLVASRMVRHDARASVVHAFTLVEARRLAAAAGLANARLDRVFGHRFELQWRRNAQF